MQKKSHFQNHYGVLYIVATPIGNLGDISLRALETLKSVDIIAAEDTRHSKKLLQHYAINTPTISLHEYNENKRSQVLIDYLKQGKNVALISDAGTPLISDPGYLLVKCAREQKIKIVPIPGACAAIAALSASGLSSNGFVFEGFLPAKKTALKAELQRLVDEKRTIILYESTHRLLKLIKMMIEVFGKNRQVVLAKELTKAFETIYSDRLEEVEKWLIAEPVRQKGEFVLLISGAGSAGGEEELKETKAKEIDAETKRILSILLRELPPKQAVKLTSEISKKDKKTLYKEAISCCSEDRRQRTEDRGRFCAALLNCHFSSECSKKFRNTTA